MRIAYLGAHQSVHTRRWISFFAARGHDVHLLSCGTDAEHRDDDYTLHDLGRPFPPKLGYLTRIPEARRLLRRLAPDVVHAHYATSYGSIGVGAGVGPLIVTAHGDDVLIAPRNPAKRAVVRSVLRRADVVTVPSEQMRDSVIRLQHGKGPEPLVFQYGVETHRLAALADSARVQDAPTPLRPLRILSARPLLALYRIDLLLEALTVLRRQQVRFVCEILGDGPQRAALVSAAERAGLTDHVQFLGAMPVEAVEQRLARADVAVSLSSSDGASLAVLEAMAMGVATVLSDIPANRAWACPEGAVLVDPRPEAVAAGIRRAAALDKSGVIAHNRRLVLQRADRQTNLARFEDVMHALHRGTLPRGVVG